MEAIRLLFGQNGSKLQEIIAKVGSKLQEKIQNGVITEDQFMNDAKRMKDLLSSKFKGIPGMPDIEQFSQKVADQISREMLDKRQRAAAGAAAQGNGVPGVPGVPDEGVDREVMPSLEELTACMSKNWTQMGFDNADQFQQKSADILAEMDGGRATVIEDPTEDQRLQTELDELKRQIDT